MRRGLAVVALLTSAVVFAPGAAADDTPCMGTLPPGPHDNVVVPPGATCTMTGATVRGNVKALQDSRLRISASNIGGNVEGDKADVVSVQGGTVRENIIIKEAGPPVPLLPGFSTCVFFGTSTTCEVVVSNVTVVQGSIQVEKTHGTVLVVNNGLLNPIRGNIKIEDSLLSPVTEGMSVNGNQVAQNLQVFKNKGPGFKFLLGNTVQESLQCFENDSPFLALGNFAREAQGQCTAAPLP